MGNRKAMFASVFIVLLLGICLVPAFAEDNVATGQDTNASMAADQLNDSELVTNEAMSVDSTSDSNTPDSSDAVKPEKPKSVYDFASEHVDDLADGLYTFGSSVDGNFVLDVPGGTASAGRKLQLYSGNKTNAQVWRVSHDQNGFVVIASVKGCTLDVPGGSASNGNPVQLWSDNGTLAQRWVAIKETDGSYTLISAFNQSFAIDVAGGVAANGSAVQLYEANGTAAQRWVLTPAKTEQQQLDDRAAAHLADLPDGTYAMLASNDSFALIAGGGSLSFDKFGYSGIQTFDVSTTSDGYRTIAIHGAGAVLDAAGGKDANGTKLQTYAANGTKAQKWIIEKDGERYRIVSGLNGQKVADVPGGSIASGAGLQLYSVNGTAAQSFNFVDPTAVRSELDKLASDDREVVKDGDYAITAGPDLSRMVLDVVGGSASSGANVQIYQSNTTAAQRWRVSHDDDGYLTITNVKSGKVLDVSAGSTSLGTNVQQYAACGDANYAQKWIAVPNGDGSVRLLSAVWQQRTLDVAGGSLNSRTNVQLYASNGTVAQRVRFVSAAPDVAPSDDLGLDGWFTISLSSDSSRVFDISGGSSSNGANVQTYAANGTFAQVFKFVYVNGYYRIVNAQSGKALDVDGGNVCPGTNVHQWSGDRNNANQLFSIARNDDGSYTATNKATGLVLSVANSNVYGDIPSDSASQRLAFTKLTSLLPEGFFTISSSASSSAVLDVAGGSASDGANVQLYGSNKSIAQKWKVAKVADRDNTYTVETLASGKVLTADEDGNVCVRSFDNSDAQLWTAQIDKGGVNFVNVATDKVLDAVGGSTSNGSNIRMYDSNGTAAQSFKLSACSLVDSGTYTIAASSNRSKVLDVASGSRSNGANVQLWSSNGSGAQKWNVSVNSDGTVSIQNCRSKKYLDVLNAQGASGANVQQWQGNGSSAQRWRVDYVGGGSFVIRSALNDSLVLDVNGGALNDGANIQIYAANGSDAQGFYFAQTSYTPEAVDLAVPVYNQYSVGLPNGCESAALTNVLNYYGFGVGPCEMADRWIPRSSWDFVWCFWGDPHSYNNGNEICAPGLNRAANNFLASRGSNLRSYDVSGTSLYNLCNYLDDGHPVIIWTTVHQGNVGNIYARQGGYFACGNSHTVVLKGYNPQTNKVMISDTIDGYTTYDRDWIAWVYQQRGAQAVVIK